MYGYERTYKTGRGVCSILEIVGWIIVVLGVIVALSGFSSGGFMGAMYRETGYGNTPAFFRIVSLVPGIVTAASGLLMIMFSQQTKATLDTSEMTRELLAISKGQMQAPQTSRREPNLSRSQNQVGPKEVGERIKVYKGHEITKHSQGVAVGSRVFGNVLEAERFIDGD